MGKGKFHIIIDHEGPQGKKMYSSTLSLTSVVDGIDGQGQAPPILTPGKKIDSHCTGGWLGPRDGLDGCRKFHTH
jgi:hypothetical protein